MHQSFVSYAREPKLRTLHKCSVNDKLGACTRQVMVQRTRS